MSGSGRNTRLIDIARQAGVSRAAVGHILNHSGKDRVRVSEETRARVLKIANELDYRPNRAAQQLRGKPNEILGVILDTVNIAVFSARLAAVEAEAHRRGYRLMIGQAHHDPKEIQTYLEDFSARGIDGVLCLFDVMEDLRKDLQTIFRGQPGAVIHAAPVVKSQPCVRVDTAAAIRLLVDHLVERGRRRIGIQLWSMSDQLMTLREQAWKDAVRQHRLPAGQQLVWVNPLAKQKPTPDVVDACIQQLVIEQKADAIIASNDEWAVRLIQGLRRRNLEVPRDVAVTGYDNLDIADVIEPGLTTIDQCHAAYAEAAVDLMLAAQTGKLSTSDRVRIVQPRLIVRDST
ncbi:LacI family DNA-binding transcriptional regulator [Planctomicrobium piriforme]|uniref:HTH lacI-type domain-containing protein n=1 Tax=Planctomicrobium piriforme TaxID=1576369 RepID=A0A1I3H0L5_9PLAN|nr:LacI family DNA-binding transcriptional regulator [Planctomicrobium piriforme]SFI29315.1 LacI family transcriptional regulator/LacI family transcriptional regulator, fructose operon transcriptional repressor/LacI family transcriptional regulator, repressor for deo operon, udp, cdd, tsx, nupC, and nupG [Planctomicrobium piriforme]